jgi:hypothetical protein
MAEQILTADDDAELTRDLEACQRSEIGEGVHDKYHRWAHELAGKQG